MGHLTFFAESFTESNAETEVQSVTKDQPKGEVICCLDSAISSDEFTTMAPNKSIYSIYCSVKTLAITETKYNLKSVTDFTYKTTVNEMIKN